MTEQQALKKLRGLIRWKYNQTDMARDAGVSTVYVNNVLNGKKRPGPKLLALIGVERINKQVKVTREVTSELRKVD